MSNNATLVAHTELQFAYDFFNAQLFNNKLPPCLITLQREKRTLGYFSRSRFINANGEVIDELAMNPSYFGVRSIAETLSTLVHEQVHTFQFHFGSPSRNGYHNKEWADKMEEIGLRASHTGKEGGKRTGQKMTHYILKGGKFDKACKKLLTKKNFNLSWYDRFPPITEATAKLKFDIESLEDEENESDLLEDELEQVTAIDLSLLTFASEHENKSNRDKYKCPSCGNQVWGKPNMKLRCGEDSCDNASLVYCE